MKTYLQRLAERAEGVPLTPPLSPTERSEVVREAGSDSFLDRAGESFDQTSQTSEDVRQYQPLQDSSKTVEPSVQIPVRVGLSRSKSSEDVPQYQPPQDSSKTVEPSVQIPVRVGLSRSKSSELAETCPEPAPVVQPRSAGNETAIPQPRKEIAFPERSIIEARSAEREQPLPMEVQRETPVGRTSPPLLPAQYVDEPFTKERQGNTDEGHRSDQLTQDVRQGLLSPIQPIERLAPTAKEVGAAAESEPTPNLEPRRTEPIRQITPIPDEPRLVIGQLTVDILPTGPTETREVVRVVQRRAGASQTLRTSPVSKLRFGLGQM